MIVYNNTILGDTVEYLNEFTNYTFELSANTSVGGGPVAVVMVTTDEDGRLISVKKGLIVILKYFSFNFTKMHSYSVA